MQQDKELIEVLEKLSNNYEWFIPEQNNIDEIYKLLDGAKNDITVYMEPFLKEIKLEEKLKEAVVSCLDGGEELYYRLYKELGWEDLPVLSVKVDIGDCSSWFTKENIQEYYLQEHILKDDFARIVKADGQIVAIGSKEIMRVKLARLTAKCFFTKGDIIAIDRVQNDSFSGYTHYGIVWDEDYVIHFAGKEHDFSGKKYIRFSPLRDFLNANGHRYSLKDCSLLYVRNNKPPKRIFQNIEHFKINMGALSLFDETQFVGCRCFDKNTTIARAEAVALQFPNKFVPQSNEMERKSVTEEDVQGFKQSYNLVENNCEHFALWCRTGMKISLQVNNCRSIVEIAAKIMNIVADYNYNKRQGNKKYDAADILKKYLRKKL